MTVPPHIDIMQTVFPVIATEPGNTRDFPGRISSGTAFAVSPGLFVTAAHVALAAQERGQLTVGGTVPGQPMLGGAPVQYVETWPDRDVALLFCKTATRTVLDTWLINRVQLLTDLSSFGYPHAVTRQSEHEHFDVVFRGYKGHVITIRGFERLQGRPAVYEISSPYPEGLSGAPVLLQMGDSPLVVAGVVLGSDTVEYGLEKHTVGIAMIADEIVELRSDRLGGSLGSVLGLRAARVGFGDPPEQAIEKGGA